MLFFEELKSYGNVANAEISFNIDLVDAYGNVKSDKVLVIGLDKENVTHYTVR